MDNLVFSEEGILLEACQDKETCGVYDIDLSVVDHIHVVALRTRSENLLEVFVNFDMQIAHNVGDEPLVLLRVTRPEQRILDEKRLEALYFVLLSRID